ncbi:SMI1/KNR4 family protein [Streptomyces griseoflavus]|uniref:SMI1/KNR4 family protein n=1 Tax=Streptomyces griseoflavus Tu4000 TaxID=467200 RepID=D9Y152_9ACTN|nr:SMI1/KNR4 family protein [Streptomyces griseoflavus]EFL38432.1 SMI1/KNR4 family protein [Streptomyces griseoflavus Tu4000]
MIEKSENHFDWQRFLRRWQEEWVPDEDDAEELAEGGTTLADLALAAPPATEAEIAAAEERLGTRLPPSYRAFLGASNGWRLDEGSIYRLGAAHEIGWFGDPFDMTPAYQQGLTERSTEQEVLLAGMWRRALQLETDSDMSYALLDPGDTDEDGEWALYVYKGWSGEFPDRYPSFHAYMQRMYQDFHSARAGLPGFVNDTTRALDADVERAREEALSGRWETARELLAEAERYGRPRARGMRQQLDALSHGIGYGHHGFGELVADPRCTGELVPVMAAAHLRDERPGASPRRFLLGAATDGGVTEAADAILAAVRDGSYRYAPDGAFGEAVAEAWKSARRGDTDAAWRLIRAALPSWSPPGPDLLAPVGLLGDPVLGPVVTRERGLELLATPRAGQDGAVPDPVPDLDPPGLCWLAEPMRWNAPHGAYRCLWVEGTEPEALPGLVGEDGGAGLTAAPSRPAGWFPYDARQPDESAPWEDRAVLAVGRTASGWAFGFDTAPRPSEPGNFFVSPAAAASRGGRAVVLWVRRGREGVPAVFHLSVAERGEELYAYTLRGTDVERTGPVPAALDPEQVVHGVDDADRERRLLAAVQDEFGLSLPRHALAEGILPHLTTRSWNRAPREGESYAYVTVRLGR